nr:retrotransposon protein, putative, Ty1-copia subclass [Tanacetum cinerariifolium]
MKWYLNLRIVLSTEDKLPFLEQPIPVLPVPPQGQANPPDVIATHQAWVKAQKEIEDLLVLEEELAEQAPPFAPIPKNPPTPKKDNPAKDAICHQCGEVGHWRTNCPIYISELMKKKKQSQGASTSGIFTIELYSFPSTSWVYDTGCGTHICITTQGFKESRKLKPGALSLYMGDGHRAAVEAIGDFHLCLPSGLDGFVNRFENDNSIFVFKNNMIYFNAIPWDDIYEIVMSSSNTNECSMYAVTNKRAKLNLDSALLWHCRLGHINKKRIEKLQHDGLLDSTDIKSFENCVSCMPGKMARKPYSHQVERAKDLLGLIHTDEHELGDLGEPANYKVALLDPESDKWLNSMNVEIQSMKDNEVWELVMLPPNAKTVGHKWLFKKKTDMDGAVHTYKARLVAKGFTQISGVDYEETFSPVADIRSIRILIAIATFYDYEIWQMDAKTAFLNGYLNEENPGDAHWTAVKNIMKYLRNTKDMFLVYGGDMKRELRVSCYTDAGYLTDADDMKSQTRYVFVLNGGVVNWKSTTQRYLLTHLHMLNISLLLMHRKRLYGFENSFLGLVLFP